MCVFLVQNFSNFCVRIISAKCYFSAKNRWKKREKNRKEICENTLKNSLASDLVQLICVYINFTTPPANSVYDNWLYSRDWERRTSDDIVEI